MSEDKVIRPVCKGEKGIPKGWHLLHKFVDDVGNVFEKGKYIETITSEDLAGEILGKNESNPELAKSSIDLRNVLSILQEIKENNDNLKEENKILRDEFDKLKYGKQSSLGVEDLAKGIVQAEAMKSNKFAYTIATDIDPDDILDKPAIFTSYGTGYHIADKPLKNGLAEKTPYGQVIEFVFKSQRVNRTEREDMVNVLCEYQCFSKKEKEWLLTHPRFGQDFHLDNPEFALSLDAYVLQTIGMEINRINQMDNPTTIIALGKDINRREKEKGNHPPIPIGKTLREVIPAIGHYNAMKLLEGQVNRQSEELRNETLKSIFSK